MVVELKFWSERERRRLTGCRRLELVKYWWHHAATGASLTSGFTHRNLANYTTGVNDALTRRKIAILMHNPSMKGAQVEDDEQFFLRDFAWEWLY